MLNENMQNINARQDRIFKIALIFWIAIIVFTGTYFRIRQEEASMQMDWLVLVRLFVCAFSMALGFFMFFKNKKFGFGAYSILFYVCAALLSVLFSQYKTLVVGYWILLSGAAFLTVALVQYSRTVEDLNIIEKSWFIVIVLILIKDTATSYLFPQLQMDYHVGGPSRLGMGVTHANVFGAYASLSFWMSFFVDNKKRVLMWIIRFACIAILVLSWSRSSMISFILAGFIRLWYANSIKSERALNVKYALFSGAAVALFFIILAVSFNLGGVVNTLDLFNRGQSLETIESMTGRTVIWPVVIRKIFVSFANFIFGSGYGVSRLIINEGYDIPAFYAFNAHNTFLEILLSAGLMGLLAYASFFIYSLRYFVKFKSVVQNVSADVALRGVSIISIFTIHSLTESVFGSKIGPFNLLIFFYIAVLDKKFLTENVK